MIKEQQNAQEYYYKFIENNLIPQMNKDIHSQIIIEQKQTQQRPYLTPSQPYLSKYKQIISLQQSGIISYKVISNNSKLSHFAASSSYSENLHHLIRMKSIFGNQLPKMPKQYITRLVFDRNHQILVILKNNQPIGGLCFRQFNEVDLAQIVFLAIDAKSQIQGFGTRLMNQFKNLMQLRRIRYLITYADNLALGYFKRQAFSKQLTIPSEKYDGYIKDYQGGTKMQYIINPQIDYLRVKQILQRQRKFIQQMIKEECINKYMFTYKNNQNTRQKFKRLNSDGTQDYFNIDPMKIPGIKQAGFTWEQYEMLKKTQSVTIQDQCKKILLEIIAHPSSWPFRQPIPQSILQQYLKIIQNPIDLSAISQKLNKKKYCNYQRFVQDIFLMFSNCKKFNHEKTIYYKNAVELQKIFMERFERLKLLKENYQ